MELWKNVHCCIFTKELVNYNIKHILIKFKLNILKKRNDAREIQVNISNENWYKIDINVLTSGKSLSHANAVVANIFNRNWTLSQFLTVTVFSLFYQTK